MNKQVFSPVCKICIQSQKVEKLSGAAPGSSSATSNLRLLLSTAARLQWQPTRQHPAQTENMEAAPTVLPGEYSFLTCWHATRRRRCKRNRKDTKGMQSGGVCFSFRMKVKHLCLLLLGGGYIFVWSVNLAMQRKTLQQEMSFCCKRHILEPWEGSTSNHLCSAQYVVTVADVFPTSAVCTSSWQVAHSDLRPPHSLCHSDGLLSVLHLNRFPCCCLKAPSMSDIFTVIKDFTFIPPWFPYTLIHF